MLYGKFKLRAHIHTLEEWSLKMTEKSENSSISK